MRSMISSGKRRSNGGGRGARARREGGRAASPCGLDAVDRARGGFCGNGDCGEEEAARWEGRGRFMDGVADVEEASSAAGRVRLFLPRTGIRVSFMAGGCALPRGRGGMSRAANRRAPSRGEHKNAIFAVFADLRRCRRLQSVPSLASGARRRVACRLGLVAENRRWLALCGRYGSSSPLHCCTMAMRSTSDTLHGHFAETSHGWCLFRRVARLLAVRPPAIYLNHIKLSHHAVKTRPTHTTACQSR